MNCLDGVRVPAAVFRRVSAAFVGVGALPPVSAGEAQPQTEAARALVPGEVTWPGIFALLDWAEPAPGERFLDCGAGHGRAVAAFALRYGAARGIEIRSACAQAPSLPAT